MRSGAGLGSGGIEQKKREKTLVQDNSMVMSGEVKGGREGYGGVNGDGQRLDLGW